MDPLIAIIMPCYNRRHTIATSFDSVLAQSFTAWELIVVDDGSTRRQCGDRAVSAYTWEEMADIHAEIYNLVAGSEG